MHEGQLHHIHFTHKGQNYTLVDEMKNGKKINLNKLIKYLIRFKKIKLKKGEIYYEDKTIRNI